MTLPDWLEPHLHRLGVDPDASIAVDCGVSQPTITYWRTKMGIGAAGKRPRDPSGAATTVGVRLSPTELALLDAMRGKRSRGEALRTLVTWLND